MRYKNIEEIKTALLESLVESEDNRGIRINMGNGSHRYWLTGSIESYQIHCYGWGKNWADQTDDCNIQDVDVMAKKLWNQRKNIIYNSL